MGGPHVGALFFMLFERIFAYVTPECLSGLISVRNPNFVGGFRSSFESANVADYEAEIIFTVLFPQLPWLGD